MLSPKYKKLFINNSALSTTIVTFIVAITSVSSVFVSTTAFAGAPGEIQNQAYVDSVTQWGAWELDIEPAAGGITQADTGALKARNSKVSLRTNSISALAPPAPPTQPVPPLPVTPTSTPTLTPISPNVPIPIGNPGI
jgi:hypothetical protein